MSGYRKLFDLTGKRALVTGSSRGIGAAIAEGLADFGAAVAIHGTTRESNGEQVRDLIKASGGESALFAQDLAELGAGRQLIDRVQMDFGELDILVVNASAQVNGSFEEVTQEEFELQINVNLRSTFDILQAVLPQMADRGWGRVVNVGSINQRSPKAIVAIYAATKAAQHNLMMSLAREYAPQGVLLNTLAPGMVDTDRNADRRAQDPEAWNAYIKQLNWMSRAGTVDEMVGAAIYLSSPACSFMTGEAMFAAGGY